MQKTQVFLEDSLHNDLNSIVDSLNISISDFINQIIKNEIFKYKQNKEDGLLHFIDSLEPLESFKNIDTNQYVNNLRDKSRIL